MPTGILKLEIGASQTMPTKRLNKLLAQCARDLNMARNAMLRAWIRWREDHPDWVRSQKIDDAGNLRVTKDGKPIMEMPIGPDEMIRLMYARGTEAAPYVGAQLVGMALLEVKSDLTDNMPYNHDGKAKYRWEAILANEVSASSYTMPTLPVPTSGATFCYCGKASRELSPGIMADVHRCGDSSAVIRFPLLSRAANYDNPSPICRIEVRQLPDGLRALLRRVASGELPLKDSKIIERCGKWWFLLTYNVPVIDHGLDKDRMMTLTPSKADSQWPFELRLPDDQRWMLGAGKPLEAEYTRLVIRRKSIRSRYKDGAGKSHGKSGFYQSLRPYSRAFEDMQDRFMRQLVADIVNQCVRRNCGTMQYREPTMPLREKLWFDQRGIPFDWTAFEGRLTFKLAQHGIVQLKKVRIGMAQHKDEYGWGKKESAQS